MKMEESQESKKTKYYVRATWRLIKLLIAIFILFLVIAGIIYLAPKILQFAVGG